MRKGQTLRLNWKTMSNIQPGFEKDSLELESNDVSEKYNVNIVNL